MIIYDLEEFAIKEIFRPYCNTYDIRIWEADFKENLTPNERFRYRNLLPYYESKIKNEKGLEWLMHEVENNITWKILIFERLSEIKFGFYKYLQHPFIDWVNKNLKEMIDND